MGNRITLILTAAFIFLINPSCEKNQDKRKFNVDLNVLELNCYPNDHISMTFEICSSNGVEPYIYDWSNPKMFEGKGPITVIFDNLENCLIISN